MRSASASVRALLGSTLEKVWREVEEVDGVLESEEKRVEVRREARGKKLLDLSSEEEEEEDGKSQEKQRRSPVREMLFQKFVWSISRSLRVRANGSSFRPSRRRIKISVKYSVRIMQPSL